MEVKITNIQIVEAVKCAGVLTSIDACIRCKHHGGRDEILQQVLCNRESKLSKKEEWEQQYKDYYGGIIQLDDDKVIIEFGDKNEQ